MFGSETLEIGIGLCLLFLYVSLICTAVQEIVEARLKIRAKFLEQGIKQLIAGKLDDASSRAMMQEFYEHPLIYSLYAGEYKPENRSLPSYIPAASFASAVIDILAKPLPPAGDPQAAGTADAALSVESLRTSAEAIANPMLKRALLAAIDTAKGDIDRVQGSLEAWFDGTMDRVSGWYKRRAQTILFFIGLAVAVCLNIDPITIAQRLGTDVSLRAAVVERAKPLSEKPPGDAGQAAATEKARFDELARELASTGYPMGWSDGWPAPQADSLKCGGRGICAGPVYLPSVLSLILGWLITALAATLGAPFWFDVLNKFMVIRSTVKPREKSQEEGSEDRRRKT